MGEPATKDHRSYRAAERFGLHPRVARKMLAEHRLPPDAAETGLEQYTTDRVAEILGVTPYTVRKWIREGRLGGTKLGRNTVRVSRADLEAFLAGRTSVSDPSDSGS